MKKKMLKRKKKTWEKKTACRSSSRVKKPRKNQEKSSNQEKACQRNQKSRNGKYHWIWKEKRWQGDREINTLIKKICSGEEKTWVSLIKKKLLIRTWNLCNRMTMKMDYVKAVLKEKD
jgi:hypothetical protein